MSIAVRISPVIIALILFLLFGVTGLYDGNNIDLLQVRQTKSGANDLLARMVYNTQHEPLLSEDGSGQTTLYTYNGQGQLLTVTDPLSETTTLSYDSNGFLQSVQGPLAGTSDKTYVSFYNGQIYSITDSEGYDVVFTYDA
jgi:YD repeat-containing protein